MARGKSATPGETAGYPRAVELSIHPAGTTTEVADEATFIDLERQGLIRVADAVPDEAPSGDERTADGDAHHNEGSNI